MDFDYATLSSLNRCTAMDLTDMGMPKVKCLENASRKFLEKEQAKRRVALSKVIDLGQETVVSR